MTRVLLRSLITLVLVVASGLIAWRVLAPAEVHAVATTPYPPAPVRTAGVTGRINLAPLVVDGRVRVYAAKHQVKADAPVDGRMSYTARWSLRRWPEQLSGVVASGATVVSRWSDGELVALDARTGEIAWRSDGPQAPGYAGHRTGAAAVWTPPGLRLAAGSVVVTSGQDLIGYDLRTGAVRWRVTTPPACTDGFTTTGGAYVCATGAYDAATGAALTGWPAGPSAPVGCAGGDSGCAGFRDGAGQGWLASSAAPRRAPALDATTATVAGGVIVSASAGQVYAYSGEGAELWRRSGEARVLGGSADAVVLLTPEKQVLVIEAAGGAVRSEFRLALDDKDTAEWEAGGYRIAGGYLAMERLRVDAPDDPESPVYYLTLDAVVIAAL